MLSPTNGYPTSLLMSAVVGGRLATVTTDRRGVAVSSSKKPSKSAGSRRRQSMVEKTTDTTADLADNFQTDANPLNRLMEQCQRLAAAGSMSVQERLETANKEKAAEVQYQQYAAAYYNHNWWEAVQSQTANWQALGAYGMDNYLNTPYLNSIPNLLQAATNSSGSSAGNLGRAARVSPTATAPPAGTGAVAGGKFNRGNCECPNCMETERLGPNNIPVKRRGIHNCHIRGCGKVYNKSSHLKAHLRWHSNDRNTKPRRSGEAA